MIFMGWIISLVLIVVWAFRSSEYAILIASALFAIAGSIEFHKPHKALSLTFIFYCSKEVAEWLDGFWNLM